MLSALSKNTSFTFLLLNPPDIDIQCKCITLNKIFCLFFKGTSQSDITVIGSISRVLFLEVELYLTQNIPLNKSHGTA